MGLRDKRLDIQQGLSAANWMAAPLILDTTGNVGSNLDMCLVNNFPGVVYYNATTTSLHYIISNVTNGGTTTGDWNASTLLNDGQPETGTQPSIKLVNGLATVVSSNNTFDVITIIQGSIVKPILGTDFGNSMVVANKVNTSPHTAYPQIMNNRTYPQVAWFDASVGNYNLKYISLNPTIVSYNSILIPPI